MNARVPQPAPDAPHFLNAAQALDQVSRQWDGDILRQLHNYIEIPAKSPMFDADWAQHGLLTPWSATQPTGWQRKRWRA